ncbi:radiation sensitive protein rad9 [Exophiala oligosperma]
MEAAPILLDSESESLDVSSIKFAVLHDQESIQDQPGSDRRLVPQRQLEAIRHALDGLSPIEPSPIEPSPIITTPATNTVPELASIVPESESLPNVESPFTFLRPAITHERRATPVQKMTSQGSDAPTQELSQSHYTSFLQSRSRSAAQLLREHHEEDDEESPQFSLREGDEGHIDLLSSLVSPKNGPSELDSEPVEYSPTQTQLALSRFPESQRFKTPATAGKKRSYDGDIIDSPVLPRNPLLGGGSHQQENIMGLSQAFAATQADTSPFVNNGNGDIPSDRPSPNIELRPRPVTATSSPMRPISAFKRASTEPASRYISVREELALREHAGPEPQEASDDEEDDVFAHLQEPDSMTKYRRRLAIEKQVKVSLQRLSSPSTRLLRRPSLSKSSPVRQNRRSSPIEPLSSRITRFTDRSSPTKADSPDPLQESEEETDLEDSPQIAVARSSQVMVALNDGDDDKENCLSNGSQVPETAARLIRVAHGDPSEVEDSPSLKHHRRISAEKHAMHSSQPFAIADSQSSQSRRRMQKLSQALKSTPGTGSVDFVPQSPTAGIEVTDASEKERTTANDVPDGLSEDVPNAMPENAASNSPVHQKGTIPETSSNEPPTEPSRGDASTKQSDPDTTSRGEFETAQSQVPQSIEHSKQQENGEDIGTGDSNGHSTPSCNRRRMTEIAAEPSPLKSQPSFNVTDALHLDAAFQSPSKRPPLNNPSVSRFTEHIHVPPEEQENTEHVEEPENASNYGHPVERNNEMKQRRNQNLHGNSLDLASTTPQTTIHSSRRLRKPTPKALENSKPHTPLADAQSRRSQWDLDASPPQKAPLTRPNSSLKRKKREQLSPADAQETSAKRRKVPEKATTASSRHTPIADECEDISAQHLENLGTALNTVVEQVSENPSVPNVVFACFNGKTRAYYPATCLGLSDADPTRYRIQWEGYDPEELDQHGVRSLDLRVGDQIKVNLQGFPKVPYIIKAFKNRISAHAPKSEDQILTDIQGYKTLLVSTKQRKSLPADVSTEALKEVPISSIYLDSNMWGQMKDRLYEHKTTVPRPMVSAMSTPAPCSSTPCSPPSRNRRGTTAVTTALSLSTCVVEGLFTNMAFAISYDDDTRRDQLERQIRQQGGLVLKESFLDLLELDSLQMKAQHADLSFTALLADRQSRKEKYMQALALGVPCLSGRWIESCVHAEELITWSTYLLPSGECAELEGATRSRVLSFDPAANLKVHEMIESRARILNGARVVVAMKSGGEKVEKRRRAFVFLIRALGAGEIVSVSDLASATAEVRGTGDSSDDEDTFVFVDDRDIGSAKTLFEESAAVRISRKAGKKTRTLGKANKTGAGSDGGGGGEGADPGGEGKIHSNVKVICNEDVVQSLILGRLWIG